MKPKIAVMLGENTSVDAKKYELSKNYFSAIANAGGLPIGISYLKDMVSFVLDECDGFFSTGGAIALPNEWYKEGEKSFFPTSERISVEIDIMKSFLEKDKPVFASCHGMQMMAGLHGGTLTSKADSIMHRDKTHSVVLTPGSKIAKIVGVTKLEVNSHHSEGVLDMAPLLSAVGYAPDGLVEAIEIKEKTFAIGCQWHQEDLWQETHPGNKLFGAFVKAAKK